MIINNISHMFVRMQSLLIYKEIQTSRLKKIRYSYEKCLSKKAFVERSRDLYFGLRLGQPTGSAPSSFRNVDTSRRTSARKKGKRLHHAHALTSTSFSRKGDPAFASDAGSFIRGSRRRAPCTPTNPRVSREERKNLLGRRVALELDVEESLFAMAEYGSRGLYEYCVYLTSLTRK